MCQPSIEAINDHLAENDLRSIDEFCSEASTLFGTNHANLGVISDFAEQPLDPVRLGDVRELLGYQVNKYKVAAQLIAWCKIFPAIVAEVS